VLEPLLAVRRSRVDASSIVRGSLVPSAAQGVVAAPAGPEMPIMLSQLQEPGKGPVPSRQFQDHLAARRLPVTIFRYEFQGPGEGGGGLLRLLSGRKEAAALKPNRGVERPLRDRLRERGLGLVAVSPLHQAAGADGRIETEEDRIEQAATTRIGWATPLIQPLTALLPGRRIQDMNGTLLIQFEAGDDGGPVREAWKVVGQVG